VSDHIAARIRIGGSTPRRLAIPLATAITTEGLSLDWGNSPFSPTNEEDLLTAAHNGPLFLYDDHARNGTFETLETFLRRHHIAFDRHSEAKYEYDAEMVSYRPGMRKPFIWASTQNGEAFVSRESIASTIMLLKNHKAQKALRLLQRELGPYVAPLQPLSFTGRKRSSPSTIETSVTNLLGF